MSSSPSQHEKLSQWPATAICGNDITSSCLYVSALALMWAGPWGPLSLLMVGGVLWLFRGIYGEVVGALPLNGGAYNALLNTTSKKVASLAACLTILSYLATAVISAHEATHYAVEASGPLRNYLHHYTFPLTIGLLSLFAVLTIRGIGESSVVALGIFIFHMASLTILSLIGGIYIYNHGTALLMENFSKPAPYPSEHPLLFGFCFAMLGISGFESSANFVEEQAKGVFPKTLRNMWIAVSVFNPLMALLALAIVPLAQVGLFQEALLARLAEIVGGGTLKTVISIDAALVLSGAVLTSFIGVTGLIHRMTLDRCLPQYFLKQSRHATLHRVIIVFFLLSSLLLYLAGDVASLAGVYTISFLSVMLLFCLGNGMLKVYRGRLPREIKVSWVTIFVAGSAVLIALVGNIYLKFEDFTIFVLYFVPTLLLITIMLYRTTLLKGGIYFVRRLAGQLLD
ncbi:MAG: APC family permease, partial [Bdellovibrionales bacterium]|nr:APC family permease [Bdellovibrionales bacterium]